MGRVMNHQDIARYLAVGVAAAAVAVWAVNGRYESVYRALILDHWTGDLYTHSVYHEKPSPAKLVPMDGNPFEGATNPFEKGDDWLGLEPKRYLSEEEVFGEKQKPGEANMFDQFDEPEPQQ